MNKPYAGSGPLGRYIYSWIQIHIFGDTVIIKGLKYFIIYLQYEVITNMNIEILNLVEFQEENFGQLNSYGPAASCGDCEVPL